jgi:hypothetical protein
LGSAEFYLLKRLRHKFKQHTWNQWRPEHVKSVELARNAAMFRTLLICAVVSASAVACTSTAPRPDAKTTAATATNPPCRQDTASRIPMRPGECAATPGRTYTDQDMQRTGQTNVGDALQLLDPSITTHH